MEIRKITVAGGGVLGAQIAYAAAFHGFDVTIWGRSEGSIERAKPRINKVYETYTKELELAPRYIGAEFPNYPRSFFDDVKDINLEKIEELKKNNEKAYKDLKYTVDLEEAFADADLVIEAIAEKVDEKRDFYEKIKDILKDDAILASNSSTFMPSMLKDFTGREERFLHLHFANNIHRQNLAEVMGHDSTSKEVIDTVAQFARDIGMYPAIIKKENPGYILNSILVPLLDAALALYGDDIAEPKDIDMDWKIGSGSPKGPFEMIDIIGINTVINVTSTREDAKDPSTPMGKALKKLKEREAKGLKGIETGEGFYKYR